jgi:hypothetical protein
LEGNKHWTLYDEEYSTPLVNSFQPVFDRKKLKNKREIILNQGDILFIPRGVPHEAETKDKSSLHLSIGVHPAQWLDLLTMSTNYLAQTDKEFREPLPLGYINEYIKGGDVKKLVENKLKNLLEKVSENFNPDYSVALLAENFRVTQKPIADGHFANLDQIDEITIDTCLAHKDFMKIGVQKTNEISRIFFQGNVIKGPDYLGECFSFISKATNGFRVSEVPLLGDEGKLKIVKRLVRGGLLQIVSI